LLKDIKHLPLHPIETTAVRADPQNALSINTEGENDVMRQAIVRRETGRFALGVIPPNPGAQSPDQEISLLIFAGGGDAGVGAPRIFTEIGVAVIVGPFFDVSIGQAPVTAPA